MHRRKLLSTSFQYYFFIYTSVNEHTKITAHFSESPRGSLWVKTDKQGLLYKIFSPRSKLHRVFLKLFYTGKVGSKTEGGKLGISCGTQKKKT